MVALFYLLWLLTLNFYLTCGYEGSAYSPLEDDEDLYASSRNHYRDTPWCSPIKVKNGHATCSSPSRSYYKTVKGTRCDIYCQKGYELSGASQVICQADKRWSGKYFCKQKRCPVLTMPTNGGFKCTDGAYFNSRCEYYCSPGYQLKGDRVVTCMDSKRWSAGAATCVDLEPPRIQCPRVKEKVAEPNKVTARIFWDTPEGRDTADGILTDVILKGLPSGSDFPEGDHRIQYTVYDRAENKASCKFNVRVKVRRCSKLNAPENGYIKCSGAGDNYGATCEFFCVGGYELQGSPARVCQFNSEWSGSDPTCSFMNINVGMRNAVDFLDQFYDKRRLIVVSTPTAADLYYRLQVGTLQQAQCGLDLRHVTVIEIFGVYPTYIGRIGRRLLPPALGLQLRVLLRIPENRYQMVVLDKHGVDKERYIMPITNSDLFTLIDSFPLRKDEMIFQVEVGHTCN